MLLLWHLRTPTLSLSLDCRRRRQRLVNASPVSVVRWPPSLRYSHIHHRRAGRHLRRKPRKTIRTNPLPILFRHMHFVDSVMRPTEEDLTKFPEERTSAARRQTSDLRRPKITARYPLRFACLTSTGLIRKQRGPLSIWAASHSILAGDGTFVLLKSSAFESLANARVLWFPL